MTPAEQFFTLDAPLHSLPDPGMMRTANLCGLGPLVEGSGGDVRDILGKHGLTSDMIRSGDSFVDCRTLVDLQDGGHSYSEILDRQRLQRAKELLRHSRQSIAEIADALGYAERTSFGRAFKRWSGQTPQAFRHH